jgi:hypothetical protein
VDGSQRLATLLATQVARVRFPVPASPTFRVEKVAFFSNPASGGTFSSTANEILKWVKTIAVASSLWRLRGRLDCPCRPLPGSESDSDVKTDKTKGVPASCGLGPRRMWGTAWKSLCKFVTTELFQRINA